MDAVAEIRQFNRFYTVLIGLLEQHLPDSDLTLQEGRVVYEIATTAGQTAAAVGRTLELDKAQLSRILRKLRARRLVRSEVDPAHARRQLLSLTAKGQAMFERLERGARMRVEAILRPLPEPARQQLIEALRAVRSTFSGGAATVTLRPLRPGDMGWIIHRQALLYAQEYDWDWTYEGLVARILGQYCASFDAAREDGWVAELGGRIVGSVFLMAADQPEVAKLRLLYVEPSARGLGVGRRLVETCIARARELGYRRLTLWTNDVLVTARRIYQRCGFRLVAEEPHHSFGKELVGQTWELELQQDAGVPA